ncbi:MAG: hypothetical protein OXG46_07440 [Chloroflexi bacterium]|nr:hypothetical protein [Chloroflexota bacterium]MCY3936734.1 hypothetical protein [Chloroflexota bacterium]
MHILATVPIDKIAHDRLGKVFPIVTAAKDDHEMLLKLSKDAVGIISRGVARIDAEIMDTGRRMLFVTRTGAGFENIDIEAATERGIPVVHAPLLADSVAEATFAMILSLTKRLCYWHDSLVTGNWNRRIFERTYELRDKTLGIIGLGRIGAEVARRGHGFKMRVVAYDPYVPESRAEELSVSLLPLERLLEESDVITIHAVSTPETDALINSANIRKIKRGAYFLNFARGAHVENIDILHEALVDGRLAGVGLDVFPVEPPTNLDHPLFSHPNFAGSPHVLASSVESEERCYRSMCRDVLAVLRGERPEWCVNPEVFDSPNLRTEGRIGGGQGLEAGGCE